MNPISSASAEAPFISDLVNCEEEEFNQTINQIWARTLPQLSSNRMIASFIQKLNLPENSTGLQRFQSLQTAMIEKLNPNTVKHLKQKTSSISCTFYEILGLEIQNKSLVDVWVRIEPSLNSSNLEQINEIRQWLKDPNNLEKIQKITAFRLDDIYIPALPKPLKLFINIKALSMVNCHLHFISEDVFSSFQNLELLDLSNNQITDLKNFPSLLKLKKLILNNNRLHSLQELPHLPELKQLDANQNEIRAFDGLSSAPTLIWIDLNHNLIQHWRDFPSLTSLTWLDLEKNRISNYEGIPQLPNLSYLNLQNNFIRATVEELNEFLQRYKKKKPLVLTSLIN